VVGDTLTLTGTGFTATDAILVGGVTVTSKTFNSSTEWLAVIPAGVSGLVSVSAAGVTLADAVTVTLNPILFQDDFSTGNFTHTENGISWVNATLGHGDIITAFGGRSGKVVRLKQGESGNGGGTELRWAGMANLTEIYVEWYAYYPNGSEDPSVGPSWAKGVYNDKFLRLWGNDQYANNGAETGASLFGKDKNLADITPDAHLGPEYCWNTGTDQYSMGEGTGQTYRAAFLADAQRGAWLRHRARCRVASVANNDGVIQLWRDSTLIVNHTTVANYPRANSSVGAGWDQTNSYDHGYIYGAGGEPAYQAGQMLYVAGFVLSTGGFAS